MVYRVASGSSETCSEASVTANGDELCPGVAQTALTWSFRSAALSTQAFPSVALLAWIMHLLLPMQRSCTTGVVLGPRQVTLIISRIRVEAGSVSSTNSGSETAGGISTHVAKYLVPSRHMLRTCRRDHREDVSSWSKEQHLIIVTPEVTSNRIWGHNEATDT